MGNYIHPNGEPEWVVPVEWTATWPRDSALWKRGMFANQNSAARFRNQFTLDQLYDAFGIDAQEGADA